MTNRGISPGSVKWETELLQCMHRTLFVDHNLSMKFATTVVCTHIEVLIATQCTKNHIVQMYTRDVRTHSPMHRNVKP